MFPEKLIDLLSKKVSKKTFIITLIIVSIINLDISIGLIVPVIKSVWIGALLSAVLGMVLFMLIKISHQKGREQYRKRAFTDSKSVAQNDDLRVEVNIYKERCLAGLPPEQEIVLYNRKDKTIKEIKGTIDFVKLSLKEFDEHILKVCLERVPFEGNHLRPHEGLVIPSKSELYAREWNCVSVWIEKVVTGKEVQTDFEFQSKPVFHVPDIEGLLNAKRDLRWLKEKIRRCIAFFRYHWYRQFYSDGSGKYRGQELKELFRIFFARIVICLLVFLVSLILLGILAVICKAIIDFFVLHIEYFSKYFNEKL